MGPVLQEAPPWAGRSGPESLFARPQVKTEISVESKHQTLQGLNFPLQPAAQRALQQLKQKAVNYIQLVGAPPAAGALWPHPAWTHVQMCMCPKSVHISTLHPSPPPPGLVGMYYPLPLPLSRRVPTGGADTTCSRCTVSPALPCPCSHTGTSMSHCPSPCAPHCTHTLIPEFMLTPQT